MNVVCAALAACVSVMPAWDELGDVIEAHERAQQAVFALEATLRTEYSLDSGQTWSPYYSVSVMRQGARARVQVSSSATRFGGRMLRSETTQHLLYRPGEFLVVEGLSSSAEGTRRAGPAVPEVRAGRFTSPPSSPAGPKGTWSRSLLLTPDPRYTLRELVEQGRLISFQRLPGDAPRRRWEIVAEDPAREFRFTIELVEEHRFSIDRLTIFHAGDPSRGIPATRFVEHVTARHAVPGVTSLPASTSTVDELNPAFRVRSTIEYRSINEPLDEAKLDLKLPAGTLVNDAVDGKFHVWGRDAPERSFATGDEFNDWYQAQRLGAVRARADGPGPVTWIGGGLLVAASAVMLIRYLRRRAGFA
ncbi:MAG: hypothetical protein KatS3mg108_1504 [Isosphaeraceae bacterium]|jgi:hypothetical protein|nr:MAG: hypothetical protein KatS3mg108_1504 [Isosphaeraceae bacterium]